ncbi:MAG: trypsin-like serine protease [Usitatibacter sp.]
MLLAAALAAALPASAILMRGDRDDAEYLELASRYASAVSLGPGAGEGVLIAPRWVLTAAHRAQPIDAMKSKPALRIAGRDYEIQSVFIPPQWTRGGSGDVALLLLRRAVSGVAPTILYRDSDESEKGVVLIGHGTSGKLGEPGGERDGKARAAINTINRVEPRRIGLRLKKGDEASDLQGAFADDETGGPAYVEVSGTLYVAGVAIGNDDEWQNYARISFYVPWIEGVMLRAAKEELNATLGGAGGS